MRCGAEPTGEATCVGWGGPASARSQQLQLPLQLQNGLVSPVCPARSPCCTESFSFPQSIVVRAFSPWRRTVPFSPPSSPASALTASLARVLYPLRRRRQKLWATSLLIYVSKLPHAYETMFPLPPLLAWPLIHACRPCAQVMQTATVLQTAAAGAARPAETD